MMKAIERMWLKNKQVLAVDDTPSIRTFLRLSMLAMGAAFHEASTAAEGTRQFNQHQPDVVVLDLGLSDRDGLTVLKEIRQTVLDYHPIIIILSVRKEKTTIAEAYSLGADAYMPKPFLMEDLLAEIKEQLSCLSQTSPAFVTAPS